MLTDEELGRLIARSYSNDVPRISRAEITRRATARRRHRRTAQSGVAATAAAVITASVLIAMNVGATRASDNGATRATDNHAAPTSSVSPPGPLDLKTQEKRCFDHLTHPYEPVIIPHDPRVGRPMEPTPTSTPAHYGGPYAPLFVLTHGGGPRWLLYFDDKDRFSTTYTCDDSGYVTGGDGSSMRFNGILAGTPYPRAAPVPPSEITKAQPYPGFVTGFVPADARTVSVTMPNGAGQFPGQVAQGVFAVWVPDIGASNTTLIATSETHIYTIRHNHMTTADR